MNAWLQSYREHTSSNYQNIQATIITLWRLWHVWKLCTHRHKTHRHTHTHTGVIPLLIRPVRACTCTHTVWVTPKPLSLLHLWDSKIKSNCVSVLEGFCPQHRTLVPVMSAWPWGPITQNYRKHLCLVRACSSRACCFTSNGFAALKYFFYKCSLLALKHQNSGKTTTVRFEGIQITFTKY